MIFVNLPVTDLQRATEFYTQLGWEMNPQFSDDNATCIVVSDTIFVMLLVEEFFSTFTRKPIVDARSQTEAILALSARSREAVDDLVSRALAAGGQESRPADDQGFMYTRAFEDPDGHLWETMFMEAPDTAS